MSHHTRRALRVASSDGTRLAETIPMIDDDEALSPQLRNAAPKFIKNWGIAKLSERLWAFFE